MKRKFKRPFTIILIAILLLIIGTVGFNKLMHTGYDSLNDIDRNMLNQLSQVYKTYNDKPQHIWKAEYIFDHVPLVLTPSKHNNGIIHTYSYVIGLEKVKKSTFAKEIEMPEEMGLPPVYRVSSLSPSLIYSWLPVRFAFHDVGDEHAAFFKYTPEVIEPASAEQSFKYFLMHELFHEYRQVPVWKNVNELYSSIYVQERNKEQYQLLLTELAILDKANDTSNKKELLNILNDFITVREARYNKFEYMEQEKAVETLEGCAQYVEYQYSNQIGEFVGPPVTVKGQNYKFADVFSKETVQNFIAEGSLDSFMDKNLYYYVGSLEGVLLDNLEINWKDRVENGEFIYDILRDEVRKQVGGDRKGLENIKNEYGYNNLEEQAQMIVNNFN